MLFVNAGWLATTPGSRDHVAQILTRSNPALTETGCLLYEVGLSAEEPDKVFVVELWESEQAHQNSLALPSVQAAIAGAMPLLSGEMGGDQFDVLGSPLRT